MRLASLAVLCFIVAAAFATGACAQTSVRWDAYGANSLTADGWSSAGNTDFSSGQTDSGTNGVWRITDNSDSNMKMYKDPGVTASQGLITARVKRLSSSATPKGNFGYSSAAGNHSIVVAVRDGVVNIKSCQEDSTTYNSGNSVTVPNGTASYRVYALRYSSGGTFDLWVSNGSDWSSVSTDWTQLVSGGGWAGQSALLDTGGTPRSGLVLGNFGASGNTWDGCVDYISWIDSSANPWDFNPIVTLPDDASYISDTIPSTMVQGQSYPVTITFKNTGTNNWSRALGVKLGAVGDSDPFCAFNRVELGVVEVVSPNNNKTFSFTMTAPSTLGTYTTDWQMIKNTTWFGGAFSKQVEVTGPDSAEYISDTIPTSMTAGQTYDASVTMKNTGTNTWSYAGGYKLGGVGDSDPFVAGLPRVQLNVGETVTPNAQKTFNFTMTAPGAGIYTTDWRMLQEGVLWFGQTLTKQVDVSSSGILVLNDTLLSANPAIQYRSGGSFQDGGWRITNKADNIYYHLPYTAYKGKVEFQVKGLNPNECRAGLTDKSELFNMYDWTFGNADTNYGGFRDNPFKHFIRKNGCISSYNNTIDCFELVLVIAPNYQEPDSPILSWNAGTTYTIREEWGPDGSGNCVFNTYRDGALVRTMSEPGSWSPKGHSVKIGCARLAEESGAPWDAVFSNLKVWDMETQTPAAPSVTYPAAGKTINTRNPRIQWAWTPSFNRYQVRVTSGNSPTTGIVWDSGVVTSVLNYADSGTLNNLTTYYVWVKLGNGVGWTDWTPSGQSFYVNTSYTAPNYGNVRVVGNSLQNNNGAFLGLGFTYMEGLGFCKNNRDRFESDLALMSSRGFNYMRILSEVPGADDQDYWYGRSINASTYTCPHGTVASEWPDYDQQFRDMVDIAYDKYGIFTEVTIFGGAGDSFPTYAGREGHCQRILNLIAGREHKIAFLEVANEAWQTGFDYPQGITDLRNLCAYLTARTSVPVAISATPWGNYSDPNQTLVELNSGTAADLATEHFERNIWTSEGGWLPVRDCWRVVGVAGIPPCSSDEPIGPGSSVASENDPIKLVSAACFAWIAKLPAYVWHTSPGVRGDYRFEDYAACNDYRFVRTIIPGDVASWTRNDGLESAAPFTVFCNGVANQYWTSNFSATSGCHRNIGGKKANQFICYPQGILSGGVTLQARQLMTFTVYNPMTGEVVLGPVAKNTGEQVILSQGPGAYIIKGTIGNGDVTAPGPVTGFAASVQTQQVNLSWTNPGDGDLAGVRIVARTDGYPVNELDGTTVFDGLATSCAHSGITGSTTYYYSAFAYDEVPNYSVRATALATIPSGFCYADIFAYPNSNLNGNNNWAGTATSEILVTSQTVKIIGGTTNTEAVRTIPTCTGSGGVISARFLIKAGAGTTTLWSIYFDDPAGLNLARWYGSGTTARGRIGGTGDVTGVQNLTSTSYWDTCEVRINTATNNSEFFFNGTSIGVWSHASQGSGDSVGRVKFERIYNSLSIQNVYIDNLVVGTVDSTPPAAPTGPGAVPSNAQVALNWTNPTASDFAETRIVFKTTGYPTSRTDGTVIYTGTGTSYNHTGLTNGLTYYYGAYARDEAWNFSSAATISAVPNGDITPPGPVTNFGAAGSAGQVVLNWTNPTDGDFAGTKILWKTTGYPANATDGTVCYSGTGTGTTHSSLVNGTRYYYSAFAFDGVPNYSTKAEVLGVAALDATITGAKALDDNQVRYLRDKVVTAAFSGYFYIGGGNPDPSDSHRGIKVVSSVSVAAGNIVTASGAMAGKMAERYLNATGYTVDVTTPGPGAPAPVSVGCAAVGGALLNAFTPGVKDGIGSNNIGSYVRVWGKITQKQTTPVAYFYINDGSALVDGTQTGGADNIGIRIDMNPGSYQTDDYVVVTGIVSLFDDGAGNLIRKILPVSVQKLAP